MKKGITELVAKATIDKTINEVWKVMKLPGDIKNFHPLIKDSYMITDQKNGIGARRHCDLRPMGKMDEIVTEWDEGKSFTLDVTGGKMLPPYVFMKGKFELKENGSKTEVEFLFSYKLKYGILGRIMNTIFIKPQFKKAPGKYVDGLKEYMEKLNH